MYFSYKWRMHCWHLGVNLILLVALYKLTLNPVLPHLHNNRNVIYLNFGLYSIIHTLSSNCLSHHISSQYRREGFLCFVSGFVQVSTEILVHPLSTGPTSVIGLTAPMPSPDIQLPTWIKHWFMNLEIVYPLQHMSCNVQEPLLVQKRP